jgi:hypothetical protein
MTNTSTEVQSPLTQDEKRRELEQDRKAREQPATYKDFTSAFANENRGGRYGKSDSTSLIKPLTSGPWSPQPGPGDEPSLGVDIERVER